VKDLVFLALCGTVCLVIQVTSMSFFVSADYKPDLFMILVFWASLRTAFMSSAIFAFAAGFAVDLYSASPQGLFPVIYCLAFLSGAYLNSIAQIDSPLGRTSTVLAATLAAGFLVAFLRQIVGPAGLGWHAFQWLFVKSVLTGLATLIVFPLMDWSWAAYLRLAGIR
jgi:rod shape-determining protein MreD